MCKKSICTVDFCRDGGASINICLTEKDQMVYLFGGIIAHQSKVLGEKEIETVIKILEGKKERMLKQHNFPLVYSEMLSDLIKVQRERYGVQDVKEKGRTNTGLEYRLSLYGLEEIIKQHFDLGQVHIHSVVGGVKYNRTRIDLKQNNRALFMDYTGRDKEDE